MMALRQRMRAAWREAAMRGSEARLRRDEAAQLARFDRLAPEFRGVYEALLRVDDASLLTPPWVAFNARLARDLLPAPPRDFLRHPTILQTMHISAGGRYLAEQLAYLRARVPPERLRALLREDPVGRPVLFEPSLPTSHNLACHLYHLARYREETGHDPAAAGTVVEWGAGYGSMARLLARAAPGAMTYVGIDTPLFTALQWLWLSAVLGPERVHLVRPEDPVVKEGMVNLASTGVVKGLDVTADLFLSTWALSESGPAAHEFVLGRGWFGAKRLLIGHQEADPAFPDANRVAAAAVAAGGRRVPFPWAEHNAYVFR